MKQSPLVAFLPTAQLSKMRGALYGGPFGVFPIHYFYGVILEVVILESSHFILFMESFWSQSSAFEQPP
jgi:hypothetical protein